MEERDVMFDLENTLYSEKKVEEQEERKNLVLIMARDYKEESRKNNLTEKERRSNTSGRQRGNIFWDGEEMV